MVRYEAESRVGCLFSIFEMLLVDESAREILDTLPL